MTLDRQRLAVARTLKRARNAAKDGEFGEALAWLQVVAQLLPQTSSESTAESGAAARAAAAVASATCWSSL